MNNNKTNYNMTQDKIVKNVFSGLLITLFVMNVYAFGVIIFNLI